MPEIIANVKVVSETKAVHRFESRITLPEYPKVGECVLLNIGNGWHVFKTAKRHAMQQGADTIEFDFRRRRFPYSMLDVCSGALILALSRDSKWCEYGLSSAGEKVGLLTNRCIVPA